jgi:hypothetical protein
MGWLLADVGTTVVVALAYWALAVLRNAMRSLALTGNRARSRGALRAGGMLHTAGIAPQRFAAADPHYVNPQAPPG